MPEEVLRFEGITKRFPGILASNDISFGIPRGTVRGLVGENGAGKTTLMRILFGMYQPDSGEIYFKNVPVRFQNPRDAMESGIAMVHQQSMLVPTMNVLENILLARPRGSLLNPGELQIELNAVMDKYDIRFDVTKPTGDLTVAERQRAEILKALYCEAELIILDEPTTVLTPQESSLLFKTLRNLSQQGKTIILITHKLPEVMAVTDEVTVLRAGRVITTKKTAATTETELANLMVGRQVTLRRNRSKTTEVVGQSRSAILVVQDLIVEDDFNYPRVKGVSFEIAAGEIVGIAAVQGNGQAELVEALFGLRKPRTGRVAFLGKDVTHLAPKSRRTMGMQYIPRERLARGINGLALIWENAVLGRHDQAPFARNGLLSQSAIQDHSRKKIHEFNIATPSAETMAKNLSGGNQQKLVLSRELRPDAALVIAEEPTQGLDIAATEFIHESLLRVKEQGNSVLLISSSLDEILDLSDRIIAMYSGEIMGILPFHEAGEQEVGKLMMGIRDAHHAQGVTVQ